MLGRVGLFVASLVVAFSTVAEARDTYVDGYTRKDGTYVQPHYRSAPDTNRYNNYSTRGNVNPYTGEEGTKDPEPLSGGYGSIAPERSNPYRVEPPRQERAPSYGYGGYGGTNPGSGYDNDPVPFGGRPPRYGR